ncbi:hypothetical protein ONZ45_g5888 [Pleurotus djamor]|nr:hypothetical protein ONZ45_g5888 [Pleurotus djamor]
MSTAAAERTRYRNITFDSPKLSRANHAKLNLDLVEDDASESEYMTFTTMMLGDIFASTRQDPSIARTTPGHPIFRPSLGAAPQRMTSYDVEIMKSGYYYHRDDDNNMFPTAPKPSFLVFLTTPFPTTGASQLPYLLINNLRRGKINVDRLQPHVEGQVSRLYEDYPPLQAEESVVSSLTLAGGHWMWEDWKWDEDSQRSVSLRRAGEFRKEMFEFFEDGEYYDFTEEFKEEWKVFAGRLGMICNAFYSGF